MVGFRNHPQKLYLAKSEKEEIYVDTPGLLQHQYEGIRFLYRQYKKGKPGVILNDPAGYGTRVQTVSFINAMRSVIKLPTLILVPECREQLWLRRFSIWTDMAFDVTIQGPKEIINPRCVVSNVCFTSALARREWGLVVVDDDNAPRDLERSGLSCKFKIWITHIDLQKNLPTFSVIYKWIYPRGRFVVDEFKANKKSPTAVIVKAARLDAFFEDIVIRRRGISQTSQEREEIVSPVRITRKNKDATGKKIKRSKPKPEGVANIESSAFATPQDTVKNNEKGEKAKNETAEEFVVNLNNDVHMAGEKVNEISVNVTPSMEIDDKHIETKTVNELIVNKNSGEQMTKENNEIFVNVTANNEIEKPIAKVETLNAEVTLTNINDNEITKNDTVMQPVNETYRLLLNSDTINSQNLVIRYDSDTPDISDDIKITDSNGSENKQVSEDLFSVDTSDNKSESKVIPDLEIVKPNDEISVTIKEGKTDKDGIEFKIKQMEELAMKKFKGSLLDNIF